MTAYASPSTSGAWGSKTTCLKGLPSKHIDDAHLAKESSELGIGKRMHPSHGGRSGPQMLPNLHEPIMSHEIVSAGLLQFAKCIRNHSSRRS